jgi:hypothetical protein
LCDDFDQSDGGVLQEWVVAPGVEIDSLENVSPPSALRVGIPAGDLAKVVQIEKLVPINKGTVTIELDVHLDDRPDGGWELTPLILDLRPPPAANRFVLLSLSEGRSGSSHIDYSRFPIDGGPATFTQLRLDPKAGGFSHYRIGIEPSDGGVVRATVHENGILRGTIDLTAGASTSVLVRVGGTYAKGLPSPVTIHVDNVVADTPP